MSAAAVAKEVEKDPSIYVKEFAEIPAEYLKFIFEKLSYSSLSKFNTENYKDVINSEILGASMSKSENHYRNLFATHRDSEELNDPHLMLLNVFDNQSIFEFTEGDEFEKKIPKLFPLKNRGKGPAVVSREQFERNFSVFTEGQLSELNWNNVFVAGGSVLSCLQPLPTDVDPTSKSSIRGYYKDKCSFYPFYKLDGKKNDRKFTASDIDIFIYGLNPTEATKKLKQIYRQIKESNPHRMLLVRTPQSVTFVTQFPFRHIQIILRCYKSPAEILMGFDIDCCCVGYDGKNVWSLPRFHRAITREYNLVDLERRSTTYESRLMKYSYRGFEVAVRGFNRSKVDPKILVPSYKASGLALLLKFEEYSKYAEYWQIYDPNQKISSMNSEKDSNMLTKEMYKSTRKDLRVTFRNTIPKLVEHKCETDDILQVESDYLSTFLPWGPRWNAENVNALLFQKSMSIKYIIGGDVTTWISSWEIGSILENVWRKEKNNDVILDEFETTEVLKEVPETVKWLTVVPGRQFIGSFHPEPADGWDKDVYLSS